MSNLAIIPARSGSKGLKDKNIRPLNGKPLIAHTIEAAIQSGQFDTVHLSTDSDKYAEIGISFGAECNFLRSADSSIDTASTEDVVKEVIAQYANQKECFDTITILQPTSPLRDYKDIQNAFELFETTHALAVVAISESDHPLDWFHDLSGNGSMENFSQLNHFARRQDTKKYYRINGAIYIMQNEIALNMQRLYGERTFGYVMPRTRSIDIDDEIDFILAEHLIKNSHNESTSYTSTKDELPDGIF